MDYMTKEQLVRRSEWREEDMALLCGIANAGGGSLMVSPGANSRTQRMKRIRKSFESIPRLTQQELGLACITEPVMDGIELCLEIRVPAADFPLRYRNNYYLYTDGINAVVTKDILTRLFDQQKDINPTSDSASDSNTYALETIPTESPRSNEAPLESGGAQSRPSSTLTEASDRKATFKERSIAAANRLDLTSTDEFILKALETNGRVTAMRIADVLGVSESTVRRSFRRLRETGFIERIGSNKAGYWRLID